MGRRLPVSASPAPSSRRCWCPRTRRTIGRSTPISPSSPPPPLRWRACGCGAGLRSRPWCSARSGRCPASRIRMWMHLAAHLFHVVAGFALAAALIVSGLLFGPTAEPGQDRRDFLRRDRRVFVRRDCCWSSAVSTIPRRSRSSRFSPRQRSPSPGAREAALWALPAAGIDDGPGDAALGRADDVRDAGAAARRHPRRHSRSADRHRIASRRSARHSRACSGCRAMPRKAAPKIRRSRCCGA